MLSQQASSRCVEFQITILSIEITDDKCLSAYGALVWHTIVHLAQ